MDFDAASQTMYADGDVVLTSAWTGSSFGGIDFFAASATFSEYSLYYIDDIAFAVDVR